jgi:hypothetical protein
MNRDNGSKLMLDRMEHDWGMNWYGGGTKSCRYLGEPFVLFSCIDWRQVEHRPDGIIIKDYSKMQYLSGIVSLEAWKQWFPMWIEKRGSNPDEMFTVLKSVVVDRIYEARTLSRSRAAATAAFRSLEPQDVLNLQIKKNI